GKTIADVRTTPLELADAKAVIAHEYAFASWADLVTFADVIQQDGPVMQFESAVETVVSGNVPALSSSLRQHPELARARSTRTQQATLLHYVAANGIEDCRQHPPANALEVAKILLDAGAEVDALADMYEHQCTTMSMLVSSCHPADAGLQGALAELLL